MKNILLLYKVIPDRNKTFFWFILLLVFGKSLFDLIGFGSIIPLIYAIFDPVKLVEYNRLEFLNLERFTELEIIYYSIIFIFLIFLIKNVYVLIYNYLMARFLNSTFVRAFQTRKAHCIANTLDITNTIFIRAR